MEDVGYPTYSPDGKEAPGRVLDVASIWIYPFSHHQELTWTVHV